MTERKNSKHWEKHMKNRSTGNKKQLCLAGVMGNLRLEMVYKVSRVWTLSYKQWEVNIGFLSREIICPNWFFIRNINVVTV